MALVLGPGQTYNNSMNKTLTLMLTSLFILAFSGAAQAQRGKLPAVKVPANAMEKAAKSALPKTFYNPSIGSAITQAQHMWKLRALRQQRDVNAVKVWAGEQNLLPDSKLYQAATKDVSYLRTHLKKVDVLIDRNVVHVNSVPYAKLLRGKNRIFIATEWNEGAKLQLSNLLTNLRMLNPEKQIVVASPYFPAEETYKSGSYMAFQQKNGSDAFVKTVLRDSNAMLIPLTTEEGATVQNTLASWSDELQPYYAAASFGKTDEVLVIIAQPMFIEGGAGSLRRAHMHSPLLNRDQSVTFSIRTKDENNLTDYKWGILATSVRRLLPPPYVSGWTQNAFVDTVAPELSDAVGTDIFIRVCPKVVSNRPQQ